MNKFLFVLLAGVVSNSGIRLAHADPAQTYLAHVAQTTLSCDDEATALGKRFAHATGAKIVSSACQSQTPVGSATVFGVLVTYKTDNTVYDYSAQLGRGVMDSETGDYHGAYTDYNACAADLKNQVAAFNQNTGYTAVDALCTAATGITDQGTPDGYLLTINGFSSKIDYPKRKLFSFHPSFSGNVDAATIATVEGWIAQLNGVTTLATDAASFYYRGDEGAVPIFNDTMGYFKDASQCTAQLDEAKAIGKGAGSAQTLYLCTSSPYGSTILEGYRDGDKNLENDFGYSVPKYFSFQECFNDRARIKAQDPANVGAICAPDTNDDSKFDMILFDVR